MKSVGEVLQSARERKELTLSQVSLRTSISENYLRNIEQGSFEELPSDVATRGFLSLFATEVGMDPKVIIALYRRDIPTPDSNFSSLQSRFFVIGQKRLYRYGASALVAGIAISACIFVVLYGTRLREAPPLKIFAPTNESHVLSPLFVRGLTSSDAVVRIDGEAIGVNQDGVFAKNIDLDPGLHVVTIKAIGRNGKERVNQLVVTVDDEK